MTEKEMLIIDEAIAELGGIMDVSPGQRAKDLVKNALGRSVRTRDPMFWPAGMLMLGLSEAGRRAASEGSDDMTAKIDRAVLDHMRLWKEKYGRKISYIDDALAGVAFVRLHERTEDEKLRSELREAADKIYKYLQEAARDPEGTIVYNADRSLSNVFADGIGQTAMFLSAYARAFGVTDAEKLARVQLANFMKHGMDDRSGLPYHGYALAKDGTCEKRGVLSWGRAAGWLIMGLSEYVKVSDETQAEENAGIIDWYRGLSKALLTYQKSEGGYGWQVQAVDGHTDTSATGMIVYGLLNGGGAAAGEVEASLKALLNSTEGGKVVSALSSCDDFGVHYQTYGNYPWGQGAALAAISLGAED